jgi:hypothetical protein
VCAANDDVEEIADFKIFAWMVSDVGLIRGQTTYHTSLWRVHGVLQDRKCEYVFDEKQHRATQQNRS